MKKFKNRDRPKKIISVVATVMACVLTVGLLSSVFGGSSLSFTSSGTGSSGSSSSGGSGTSDALLPTSQMINSITFDEPYTYSAGDKSVIKPGDVRLDTTCIKYGSLDTTQGYLEFKASEIDNLTTNSSILSFYVNDDASLVGDFPLNLAEFQVLTVDFDIWSSTGYFPDFYFDFYEADIYTSSLPYRIAVSKESDGGNIRLMHSNGGFLSGYVKSEDFSSPVHCTYVVHTVGSDDSGYSFYINGELFYTGDFLSGNKCTSFDVVIPRQEIFSSYSICIDNIQIYSYGNINDKYDGDLAGAINSLDLTQCRDWIYYGKYTIKEDTE